MEVMVRWLHYIALQLIHHQLFEVVVEVAVAVLWDVVEVIVEAERLEVIGGRPNEVAEMVAVITVLVVKIVVMANVVVADVEVAVDIVVADVVVGTVDVVVAVEVNVDGHGKSVVVVVEVFAAFEVVVEAVVADLPVRLVLLCAEVHVSWLLGKSKIIGYLHKRISMK